MPYYSIKILGIDKVFKIDANNSKQAIQFFIENNVTVNKPIKENRERKELK